MTNQQVAPVMASIPPVIKPTPTTTSSKKDVPNSKPDVSDWQQDLNQLLRMDGKLPYEDMQTQRFETGAFQKNTNTSIVGDSDIKVPVGQCDSCYNTIHVNAFVPSASTASVPSAAASPPSSSSSIYCWTCHQVFCHSCSQRHISQGNLHLNHNAHPSSRRSVDDIGHTYESLDIYLTQSSQSAYCSEHGHVGPKVPQMKNGQSLKLRLEDGNIFEVRHGIRSRALRFNGVYEYWCETCQRLLCSTCRQMDGLHGPFGAAGGGGHHPLLSLSTALTHHHRIFDQHYSSKLETRVQSLKQRSKQLSLMKDSLEQDIQNIRYETMKELEENYSNLQQYQIRYNKRINEVRQRIGNQLRNIAQLCEIQQQQSSSSSSSSSASNTSLPLSDLSILHHLSSSMILRDMSHDIRRQLDSDNGQEEDELKTALLEAEKTKREIRQQRKEKEEQIKASGYTHKQARARGARTNYNKCVDGVLRL